MMIGWLHKKGDRGPVKLWKLRYFIEVTDPDSVLYFEKNPGPPEANGQYSKETYLGEIVLDRVVNVSSTPNETACFDVWTLHGRTYKLKAPSVQEKVLWMNVFNKKLVQDREEKELNTKNMVLNGRHTIQAVTDSSSSSTKPSLAKSPSHDPSARRTIAADSKDDQTAVSPTKRKSAQEKRKTQLDDIQVDPSPVTAEDTNSSEDAESNSNKDMKRGRHRTMSMSELDVEIELQETKPDVELQEFTPAQRPQSKIVRMDSYTQLEVPSSSPQSKPSKSPSSENNNNQALLDIVPKRKNSSFLRRTLPPELASTASREIAHEMEKEKQSQRKKGQRKSMNLESLDIDPPGSSPSLLDDVSPSKNRPLKSSLKSAFTGSYQGKSSSPRKKNQISFKPSSKEKSPTTEKRSIQSSRSVGHIPKFREIVSNGNVTIVKRHTIDLPELDEEPPKYASVGKEDDYLELDERISLRLIQMALITHAKTFELENSYWEFKQLHTQLSTVPKQIILLKQITSLSIVAPDKGEFASFPDEIGQLANLTYFRCLNGQLKSFPAVSEMLQLNHLELSGHSFSEIPSTISKLTNLKVLMVYGCGNLATVPSTIGSLENLEVVDLHDCALPSIPDSIQQLTKLRILNLSGNQLKESPFLTQSLDELHLSNNNITDIPASLAALEFKKVTIVNNPLLPELCIRADNWKRLTSYILSREDPGNQLNLVDMCLQVIKKNKNQVLMAYVVNTDDQPNTLISLLSLDKTDPGNS